MSGFDRQVSDAAMEALSRMAGDPHGNWWCDLLSLWAPSGHDGELRLAIRNGYLNFYSCGQSVARVAFSQNGEPTLSVHAKYATGNPVGPQSYITLRADEGCDTNGRTCAWGGVAMVRTWIAASARHRGVEKRYVEKAVAESPTIIDLEMGLPASKGQATPLRMDIVALERREGAIRIVCWEAKMIGDGRLRSSTFEPEVLSGQVDAYERFLSEESNAGQVIEAYRRACRLLLGFHAMARTLGSVPGLDPLIGAAAEENSPLEIDHTPRLLVFDDGERRNEAAWQRHLAVLRQRVPVVIIPARPYGLPTHVPALVPAT